MATPKKQNEREIPTFAADGRRLRNYSLGAVEHLYGLSKVVVKRTPGGRIKAAQFRGVKGANPLRATAHAGTRYSFLTRCGNYKAWEHRDELSSRDVELLFGLTGPRSREEELRSRDCYVRAVFLAVPLSCLASREARTAGAARTRRPKR